MKDPFETADEALKKFVVATTKPEPRNIESALSELAGMFLALAEVEQSGVSEDYLRSTIRRMSARAAQTYKEVISTNK